MKYCLLLLIVFSIPIEYSFSQTKPSPETYYKLFDSHFHHKNYEIFNGLEYIDEYPELKRNRKTNNKFYGSFNFQKGFVIYDEQPYYDLEMKYDLFNDCILLKYLSQKINYLKLNSKKISRFRIKEDNFIKLKNNPVLNTVYRNGFFKEGYNGKNVSLYIKCIKNKQENLDPSHGGAINVFEKYKAFFVIHKNVFYRISSKRDLLKAFSSREKEIRSFYKNNSSLRKTNKEHFFVKLIKQLDIINYTTVNR